MNIERAFQILGIEARSPLSVIKQRYYDLVAVWHPDRHAENSRRQDLASEKMKEINSAYATIRLFLENHVILPCPSCGTDNRKQIDQNIDYAICSSCGKQLKKPVPRKQKIPCGNYRCAGTIGSNNRCNYCGKTVEEAKTHPFSTSQKLNRDTLKSFTLPNRSLQAELGKNMILGFAFLTVIIGGLYLYFSQTDSEHLAPSENEESKRSEMHEPAITSNFAEKDRFISKSYPQPVEKDQSFYRELFNSPKITNQAIIQIQLILNTLGYNITTTDGILSDRIISCLKQYSTDFGYIPKDDFPSCFFKDSFFHYQIALEHNDWPDIYLTSDLKNWIDSQPDKYRKEIYGLNLDDAATVVQVIRKYKFLKFKPLPAVLPETGIIQKNFKETNIYLKIKTRTENNNYYIKLIDLQNKLVILSAFIRSGSTLSVGVPFGVYELKYAAGPNWYGIEYLFGTSGSYGKLPSNIVLTEKTRHVGDLTIDLIPAQHGSLATRIISEYDF